MSGTVSVAFLVESAAAPQGRSTEPSTRAASTSHGDALLAAVGQAFGERRLEATFKLSADRAEKLKSQPAGELHALLKSQDAAFGSSLPRSTDCDDPGSLADERLADLDWAVGVEEVTRRESRSYLTSTFLAGRIPSAYANDAWTPYQFGALHHWGIRVAVSPHSFLDTDGKPFFFGGRLNLSQLGPNWIELNELVEPAQVVRRVQSRIEPLQPKGGVVCIRLAPEALFSEPAQVETYVGALLGELKNLEAVAIESARQVADRYADISYEHRIAMDDMLAIARHAASGNLKPYRHKAGYLSPAEQLYLLAAAWSETRQKGKLVRNSTTRTPLGPAEEVETDADVRGIMAGQLTDVLAKLLAYCNQHGQLPASLEVEGGKIAIQDLLPTLAGCFNESLAKIDLILKRGRLANERLIRRELAQEVWRQPGFPPGFSAPKQLELTRLQLWTYKPVLDITEAE